jgi:23S rRNA-/tRNA-specific pseudouridylate synthase
VLLRGVDPETGEKISHMELSPKTGRTHQIRVHVKHLNHPVICDPLYAKGRPGVLELTRPALHASSLTITLPSGERRTFEAPLSEDMEDALAKMVHKSV